MLTRDPIVQIHPSRFCNYACLHCYSSSSPDARDTLSVENILSTTRLLADEGYRHASLSGGEPVLYTRFAALSRGLREQGYATSVITNGTRPRQLLEAMQAGWIASASVSFDGDAPLHDRIRRKTGAFDRAVAALQVLLEGGMAPGVVIAVTHMSLPVLPDLVARLVGLGVRRFQLHPLAAVGRAIGSADRIGPELDQEALLRLLLLTVCLRHRHPGSEIHCDALVGDDLDLSRSRMFGALISPIVLRDDGAVVPYAYDVSPALGLGRVGGRALRCRVDAGLWGLLNPALRSARAKLATTVYREIVGQSWRMSGPASRACTLEWRADAGAS